MEIYFENKSKDLGAEINFKDKSVMHIPPVSSVKYEIAEDFVSFSVKYVRDFTFGYQSVPRVESKLTGQITDKITEKAVNSIGNAIVQIVNTYKVSNLAEGAVIVLDDKAYYLSATGIEAFLGCFPSIYYFGQAECESGNVEFLSGVAFNRPDFLSLYKLIYRTINLHGLFFNLINYKVQIERQRKISSTNYITATFKKLYTLSLSEREYQFQPLLVLKDKFFNFIKGKLPKRIYNKLVRKFKRYFNI